MKSPSPQVLIIAPTVGYMLKVLKNGRQIKKYNDEFKAIRHGDYYQFLKMIDGPRPVMVKYEAGNIRVDNEAREDDCDFLGLLNSGQSLRIFFQKCCSEYGQISDSDISDGIYGKCVLFELSLRMHSNNNKLINKREDLVDVIDKLSKFIQLSTEDTQKIHNGRRFLNMIKHNKQQFPSWSEGIKAFEIAYQVLLNNHLTIT